MSLVCFRSSGGTLDLSQAAETAGSIESAMALSSGAAKGNILDSADQQKAQQVLASPIAASGVLASASAHLQSSQKWREAGSPCDAAGGAFKLLIASIIPRHPLLLFKVWQ